MVYPSGPPPHRAAPPPHQRRQSGLPGWAWALIGVGAAVVVLFALLLAIGLAAAPDTATSASASATSSPARGGAAPEAAAPPKVTQPTTTSTAAMRKPVSDGAFAQFEVTGVQTGLASVGDFLTESAQGVYVLIDVTITNTSRSPISFSLSQQVVRDAGGRAYQIDSSATVVANDNTSWITDINPGNSVHAVLVVDVPPTAVPASISLRASGGRPVTIALR